MAAQYGTGGDEAWFSKYGGKERQRRSRRCGGQIGDKVVCRVTHFLLFVILP